MKRFAGRVAFAVAALVLWAAPIPAADPVPPNATPAKDSPASAAKSPAADDAVRAYDWPQWRGPNRNGVSPEKITWPASGPKQLWKAAVGKGYSSVSISHGRAYTMGSTNSPDVDTVWCLDAKTGTVVWKYSYPCHNPDKQYPGPRATPTVDGNLVYTVSYSGQLHALNAETGAVVWGVDYMKDFGSRIRGSNRHGFSGSPLVDGNLLLANVGGKGASVVAFDKTTGNVVWKSGDDPPTFSSPVTFALGAQRIVAMFGASGLFGYNLADGKLLWNVESKCNGNVLNAPDPVVNGDKIFITSGVGGPGSGEGCFLLKIADGNATAVYRNTNLLSQIASPVFIDGVLYCCSGYVSRKGMVCLDFDTGDIKWKNPKVCGSLIAAGNRLIIQSVTGHLIVAEASPDGYKEIGRAPVLTGRCWTAPSLANGCVYCRNTAGDVVCFDLSGK
ncbi:MAG TPA: PQQ-binding-like beta-propeller repeat protein [Phycisphaerae bacterium]|nr:PQQ-binding-like beta-propeller repeat protein [Phycisphaerae bacterium]